MENEQEQLEQSIVDSLSEAAQELINEVEADEKSNGKTYYQKLAADIEINGKIGIPFQLVVRLVINPDEFLKPETIYWVEDEV